MQNKTILAGSLALILGSAASVGQAELSANIGATSNYLWRGVTQTDDGAAIQGGVDFAHESGFYAGTWASNIDWGVGSSGVEVDLYGGLAGEVNDFGYDMGVIFYIYPDSDYDDSNFSEIYLSGSYKWFSAGLAYTWDSDADDDAPFSDGDLYYHAGASVDLGDGWSLGGTIGYYDFDVPNSSDVSYTHYQLDLGKSAGDFGDFTFTLSQAEEESGDDDVKVLVSWGKSF